MVIHWHGIGGNGLIELATSQRRTSVTGYATSRIHILTLSRIGPRG